MTTLRLFVLFSVLLLPITVALATSNYQYGPDEYVTVSNGISPDGKFAITAHGGGELGYDDFHLYLTNAITGKRIGPLEEIKETLDTGADAFAAKWSKDSQRVTIVYRVDRHAPLKAVSYRIADRRARRIHGPYDVKSKDLIKYWQTYGSGGSASPKIFGTPPQARLERLTNRWSQPLAVVMSTFNFMKESACLPRSLPPAVAQLRLVRPLGSA